METELDTVGYFFVNPDSFRRIRSHDISIHLYALIAFMYIYVCVWINLQSSENKLKFRVEFKFIL